MSYKKKTNYSREATNPKLAEKYRKSLLTDNNIKLRVKALYKCGITNPRLKSGVSDKASLLGFSPTNPYP